VSSELSNNCGADRQPPLDDPGSFGAPGVAIKSNSSRAPGPLRALSQPEPMTVPRGASRSNRRPHPSRLGWARGFLPSWPCEFDSRHPLHSTIPIHHVLSTAPDPKMIRRLRALGPLWAVQGPWSSPLRRGQGPAARLSDRHRTRATWRQQSAAGREPAAAAGRWLQ
jgi:hypothetical protein